MNHVVCTACGFHGPVRNYGCSRVGILLFLLLFGIIPGVLYALYIDAWVKRCPDCDQKAIIPDDSPVAAQMGIVPAPKQQPAADPNAPSTTTTRLVIAAIVIVGAVFAVQLIRATIAVRRDAIEEQRMGNLQAMRSAGKTEPAAVAADVIAPPKQIAPITATAAADAAPATVPTSTASSPTPRYRSLEHYDARRTATRFLGDETREVFHVETCADAESKTMPRMVEAMAKLKGYKPHSCETPPGDSIDFKQGFGGAIEYEDLRK